MARASTTLTLKKARNYPDFKLLAMDMDSTLITIECIDEIADFAGKKAEVAAITEAAMKGEISNFEESLRRRVMLLAGTSAEVLRKTYDERLKFSPGAQKLFDALRAAGTKTLLATGGFSYFSDRIKNHFSIDFTIANTFELINGKITGAVFGPIVDATAKAEFVIRSAQSLLIKKPQIMAIGDGANDIAMLNEAGFSVAYHAKEIVRTNVTHRIDFGGLDILCDWLPSR